MESLPPDETTPLKPKGTSSLYNDLPSQMTKGRKLARLLATYGWYHPKKEVENDNSHVSLDSAWEYFEHIVLPRCFADDSDDDRNSDGNDNEYENGSRMRKWRKKNLIRAEPGEYQRPTKLYPAFGTNDEDMGDFGIGIGLYFNKLKFLSILSFLAGLINLPNMLYFASEAYEGKSYSQTERTSILTQWGRRTSAVCRNVSWQPCPTCASSDFSSFPNADDRLANAVDNYGNQMYFIKKNHCNINDTFSIVSYITIIFMIVAVFFLIHVQRKMTVSLDEQQSTAADYTIAIENPPNDARDPEEWKEFFESRFEGIGIRACTIALDNQDLVQALIRRRKYIQKLKMMLPSVENFDSDDLEAIVASCQPVPRWKKIMFCVPNPKEIYFSIQKEDTNIQKLIRKQYNVAKIFMSFETEQSQRDVLETLSLPIFHNQRISESKKFRGEVTLKITTAEEPDAIRWGDLNVSLLKRNCLILITTIISFAFIVGGAGLIALGRKRSPAMASTIITICNQLTPMIVMLLTSYESHPNESSYSASNYIKMTAFRCMNTAVIFSIITPFTDTIQDGEYLIDSIFTMFLFDLILTPALGLLDISGNLNRHIFGPRASSQRLMNLCFKADTYDIGAMETNITRVFFFTLYYCLIFPAGFFYASIIFYSAYLVDRFSILRSWHQSPQVSGTISRLTNNFFLLSMLFYTTLTSYDYSQFPFDNACKSDNDINDYIGDYDLTLYDSTKIVIEVTENDSVYNYCNQDLLRKLVFLPKAVKQSQESMWMNDSQKKFSPVFGWTMVVTLVLIVITLTYRIVSKVLSYLYYRGYIVRDEEVPTDTHFSDVPEISGYIPQVNVDGYQFPFLLCDIDAISEKLLNWNDPYRSYDYWNMLYDIPEIAQKKREERELHTNDAYVGDEASNDNKAVGDFVYQHGMLFSIVKDWGKTE